MFVAVGIIALAGFAVYRLQGAYNSQHNSGMAEGAADQIVPFNPKRVVLEVFGPPGEDSKPAVVLSEAKDLTSAISPVLVP